jgi:hypothetical protein
VAAPAVSYAMAAPATYARVNIGVGHSYGTVGAGYSTVGTVRVSAAPAVVRVKVQAAPRRGLLGRIADRLRARRGR